MARRPRYESDPPKLLIHLLGQMFPGFRPTEREWDYVAKALRQRFEGCSRKKGSYLASLPDDITRWSGRDLLAVLMEPIGVVSEPITHVKKDSRHGKKTRDCGLTCTEMLLVLAEADPVVQTMKPPAIRQCMINKWDAENPEKPVNAFSIRAIQDDPLYLKWQALLEELRKGFGMSEAVFREEGLAILSHKPGREDKRREGRAKTEQALRKYLAQIDTTAIQTKRDVEAKKAARSRARRQ
jgi:hypothetical protein